MISSLTSKLIGDRDFYKKVFIIAFPIIIQNSISNFVQLLDNIMVGQVGTDQMNAVAIVNRLMFVFNLCVWGSVCGAGIFTAQYFGKGDHEGVRNTFRAKIILVGVITIVAVSALYFKGSILIDKFIHESDNVGNAAKTMEYGKRYLLINLIGLIPLSVSFIYSNTLRDIGETSVPMRASIAAVGVNLVLNYLLIFNTRIVHVFGIDVKIWGADLGVEGAAIATVCARFVDATVNVLWTHTHKSRCRFIEGALRSLRIPFSLMKKILKKGTPLAMNETMWALGLTILDQRYSLKGLYVVGALSITNTITNFFNVFFFAIGESISIIVGQLLGARKNDEAKSTVPKMIFISMSVCVLVGFAMAMCRNIFPAIYNTEQEVRDLASKFILIVACFMPIHACLHGCYFTIRSGGKTLITCLFDSVFVWTFAVSSAYILTEFTNLNIVMIYFIVTSLDLIKCAIGLILVKKGVWINNMV